MKFGLHLPNTGGLARQADLVGLAREAEALGLEAVWVSDRLLNPPVLRPESARAARARTPDATDHYYDALVTLAVVGGATSRIRLGTRVLLPALRNPVVLAKEVGTLAALVGAERLLLGVGAGWMFEEFEAVGLDPRSRFALLEESVALARQAWASGISRWGGAHYRHAESGFHPVPGVPIPIIVGGTSDAALRRVARWGDGWAMRAVQAGPELGRDLQVALDRLRRACDEEGRDADGLIVVAGASVHAGPPVLDALREVGVDHCDLTLDGPEDLTMEAVATFMSDVAPGYA